MEGKKTTFTKAAGIRLLIPAALIALSFSECASFSSAPRTHDDDFITVGFLDNNVLQLVIRARPDAGRKGLVARRDSAKERADRSFNILAAESIADFRAGMCKSSPPETRRFLVETSAELLKYGTRVREYFGEDESILIVYRLTRNNIRGLFEGLACGPDAGAVNDKKGERK